MKARIKCSLCFEDKFRLTLEGWECMKCQAIYDMNWRLMTDVVRRIADVVKAEVVTPLTEEEAHRLNKIVFGRRVVE